MFLKLRGEANTVTTATTMDGASAMAVNVTANATITIRDGEDANTIIGSIELPVGHHFLQKAASDTIEADVGVSITKVSF